VVAGRVVGGELSRVVTSAEHSAPADGGRDAGS